jgi:two-component system sensor histidine kinase/response regulator
MQQKMNGGSALPVRFPLRLFSILILLLVITGCGIGQPVAADSSGVPIRIGVLAHKGIDECKASWQPTIDYLNSAVPGYRFTLVPLTFENIGAATADHEIDFVLSNPGIFEDLEVKYGVSNILTLNNFRRGHFLNEFGGVIIARKDRQDIRTYNDLKGKRIIAAGKNSFGGWYSGFRELKSHGIDPAKDFASLRFSESHPDAVFKVLDREADAGIIRTDTLEQMEDEGKIRLDDLYVFPPDAQYQRPDFPLLYSTRLYPEWAFAKLPQTDNSVASAVAVALLSVTKDSPAAQSAKIGGWISPVNYESIHDCLKEIRAPPYENYGVVTLEDIVREYLYWIIAGILLIAALLILSLRLIMANRQLNALRKKLEEDINKRKQMEEALTQANKKLNLLSSITRHDITNQLTVLQGYLIILEKKSSPILHSLNISRRSIRVRNGSLP